MLKMKMWTMAMITMWFTISPAWAADLTFDVGQATEATYTQLLTNLRNLVNDPNLNYGGTNIPVMRAPTNPPMYITIDLQANVQGTVITVALSRNDLYVVAYLDKIDGKERAHFFPDAPTSASSLFPGAKGSNRIKITYVSLYDKIEKAAKIERSKLGLGVNPLNKWINEVYGKKLDVPSEAKFLLIAIQMLSESARFKYIENMILENLASYYNPDHKAIEFEKSWEKTSKAVKSSKNGVIDPPLQLRDEGGDPWIVTRVVDVAGDVGLFKNVKNSYGSYLKKLWSFIFSKDGHVTEL